MILWSVKKVIVGVVVGCFLISVWFLYSEIYRAEAQYSEVVSFKVESSEAVSHLADRLAEEQIIRNASLFKLFIRLKGIDRKVSQGEYEVKRPITLARIVEVLKQPGITERTITIIPGWDLRDIAEYLKKEGITAAEELYAVTGEPAVDYRVRSRLVNNRRFKVAVDKPNYVSWEGYFAPNTYRIYKNATVDEIIDKLIKERDSQFTEQMYEDIKKAKRTVHEVLTMASILEREIINKKDKALVADIFWRRHDVNMGLQADSTVHYAMAKKGVVFTTKEDRNSTNIWNTYRYPGLPPGPISNPSLESIRATLYPEKNDYWYFLTTLDTGEVKYAKTLEAHNENVRNYL